MCVIFDKVERIKGSKLVESKSILSNPQYTPNQLLDAIIKQFQLRSDAGLSRFLEVEPPVICKVRARKAGIGASLLIRMHDKTGLSIDALRSLMGVPKEQKLK